VEGGIDAARGTLDLFGVEEVFEGALDLERGCRGKMGVELSDGGGSGGLVDE
jgi:hypothetical protein